MCSITTSELSTIVAKFQKVFGGKVPYSISSIREVVLLLRNSEGGGGIPNSELKWIISEMDARIFPRIIKQLLCLNFSFDVWSRDQIILLGEMNLLLLEILSTFLTLGNGATLRGENVKLLLQSVELGGVVGMLLCLHPSLLECLVPQISAVEGEVEKEELLLKLVKEVAQKLPSNCSTKSARRGKLEGLVLELLVREINSLKLSNVISYHIQAE